MIDASSLTNPFRNVSDNMPTHVKVEPDTLPIIKQELSVGVDLLEESLSAPQVQTRTVLENGTGTIEILSDSEDDEAMDDGLSAWDMDVSSDTLIADRRSIYSDEDSDFFDEDVRSCGTSSDIDTSDLELAGPQGLNYTMA
jgi:hypothetical protein